MSKLTRARGLAGTTPSRTREHRRFCSVHYQGREVAGRVLWAVDFWSRWRGLAGRKSLAPGEGCYLYPCSSIHMLGMSFAIDALFLDEAGRVVKTVEALAPWTGWAWAPGARAVLELPAGTVRAWGITLGDRIEVRGPGAG